MSTKPSQKAPHTSAPKTKAVTKTAPAPAPALQPVDPSKQTRSDVEAELESLRGRIGSMREFNSHNVAGILIRQREAMIALESILDERLRTGEGLDVPVAGA